jgi:hypothetical protein
MNTSKLFITLLVVIAISVVSAARFEILTYTSTQCSNAHPTSTYADSGVCVRVDQDGIQFNGKFECAGGSSTNISLTKYTLSNCSGSPTSVEYLNSTQCNDYSSAGIKFISNACSAGAQLVAAIVAKKKKTFLSSF